MTSSPSSDEDDASFIAAALRGEPAGFSGLFARHRAPLYRLIRAQVRDEQEALDLVQEAFASAFAALGRYDPALPFRPWLSRIALNKCRDAARRRMVRRLFAFALPIGEAASLPDPQPDTEGVLVARDTLQRTMAAIASLPASLREPLTLCTLDELSQREAAGVLGISEKAVELRIRRARARLSEILGG
ncbi:RNA polymerase sigma factor [Sphingomonas sp. AP4-R1]|uniref:RNA polymerase sigma factor n=1 Tax=Sphingomonas sp. AP4-R1 TaxID=2735134 RepID=UPI001493B2C0|nr:RNA polymerase sigma factor [Sphingomonas sp. AP4-R1]QJU58564.1 RNA polymerase sigma factor [Sphingomonas sp. AP4-R1]